MAVVEFYGDFRAKAQVKQKKVQAATVKDLVQQLCEDDSVWKLEDFDDALVFLNKQRVYKPRKSTQKLTEDDVMLFLSPASGG